MAAKITLLCGPARSGKTERLLAGYRAQLLSGAPGSALWICPTHWARQAVRERLLSASLPACFAPGIETFDGFAHAILERSSEAIRPLSLSLQRRLVRRLIDASLDEGKLSYFAPIAASEGFLELVVGFLRELKRLEIWPEHFAEACRARGESAKDRELAGLYKAYQDALRAHRLYDREGTVWAARRLLREGKSSAFEPLQFVVVDGFTDFTRTQQEILELLAARAKELWISLPAESASPRSDLFAKTSKTLSELRRRHPEADVVELPRRTESEQAWPALAHIERELFHSPHDITQLDEAERIEILAGAKQIGELELVGRRIKRLLLDGVSPADVAVVFRSTATIAPLVREVFGEMGIPFSLDAAEPLETAPALRALLSLLHLHVEDWPFRRLLAVLANNYLEPSWPEWNRRRVHPAAERLIRELQIPAGRAELLRQLEYWAGREVEREDSFVARRHSLATTALPLLNHLSEELERLPKRASATRWLAALRRLAKSVGILAQMRADAGFPGDEQRKSNDDAAWERLEAALAACDRLADWLGEPPEELTAEQFLRLVSDVARSERLPRAAHPAGCVRVLSAAGVRTLEVPYLFVAGLSEKSFPQPEREDRLYSEADYRRLIEQGLPLVDRAERTREEMLLFYEVMTRASRRLWLSYPALNEEAQPLSPSSYLLEVERTCAPGAIAREELFDLSPLPPEGELHRASDWRASGVAKLLGGAAEPLAGLVQAETSPGLADHLLTALRVIHERSRGASFGLFEGVLPSESVSAELENHFGSDYAWSPSSLEQYASCPHQFFLQRVLRLEGVDDLSLQVDYLQRGHLIHNALAVLHQELNAAAGGRTTPVALPYEEFRAHFERVLASLLAETAVSNDLEAAQREIDRYFVAELAEVYYEQHRKYDKSWAKFDEPLLPGHFEVRFGPRISNADGEDPLSTDEPFYLEIGGERIAFTGRIDRIDVGAHRGQRIFNVVDYKSGKVGGLRTGDIEAGRALQLPLYAMAAEALLSTEQPATPWQIGYWRVRDRGFGSKSALEVGELAADLIQATQEWIELREKIAARVAQMIAGIRAGAFPMHSADENCTSFCEFSTVCRVHQVRALGKTWPPPEPQVEE